MSSMIFIFFAFYANFFETGHFWPKSAENVPILVIHLNAGGIGEIRGAFRCIATDGAHQQLGIQRRILGGKDALKLQFLTRSV